MSAAIQSDAFAGTAHQRPRPKRFDKAIRIASAEALIPKIERWSGESIVGEQRDRIVDIIASQSGSNGYELAREFEGEGFGPDAELVEILDNIDSYSIYAEAVRVWLAETGAEPRLALGAVVRIPRRAGYSDGFSGEITRVDERSGEYTVCCAALGHVREGLGTHGLVYPWEEIEALNADVQDGDASRVVLGQGTV